MTFRAFNLILGSQLRSKWGRFILSAGGIVVGVWAITMTTSLSLGLSDTIITAVNSQSFAREIQIFKDDSGVTNFFELSGPPVFVPLSAPTLDEVAQDDDRIKSVTPAYTISTFVNFGDSQTSCSQLSSEIRLLTAQARSANSPTVNQQVPETEIPLPSQESIVADLELKTEQLEANCNDLLFLADQFERFYENNQQDWYGSTDEPSDGEIAICYRCGNAQLYERFDGVSEPEDLVGKTLTLEYSRAPELYPVDTVIDVTNFEAPDYSIANSPLLELEIVSVIDDREANSFAGVPPVYLNDSYFQDAAELIYEDYDINNYGVTDALVVTNSYEDVQGVSESLSDQGYLNISPGLLIVNGISAAFTVLTVVLAGFGIIALIASVFGIVAVMTISVLERKKEIGILKSLGAKNTDIFWLFVLESGMIGVIGWLIGFGLALGVGQLISLGFKWYIDNNPSFADNLEVFNINDFAPDFPWWLVLGTLSLAVFFTVMAGVFPAIRAARQNPVEVLRSE
jgi:ABC-type antimicrobial peptide transport system permease subunit